MCPDGWIYLSARPVAQILDTMLLGDIISGLIISCLCYWYRDYIHEVLEYLVLISDHLLNHWFRRVLASSGRPQNRVFFNISYAQGLDQVPVPVGHNPSIAGGGSQQIMTHQPPSDGVPHQVTHSDSIPIVTHPDDLPPTINSRLVEGVGHIDGLGSVTFIGGEKWSDAPSEVTDAGSDVADAGSDVADAGSDVADTTYDENFDISDSGLYDDMDELGSELNDYVREYETQYEVEEIPTVFFLLYVEA